MKKSMIIAAFAAIATMVAGTAMADIINTRHNLGSTGDYQYAGTATTEICVFCHTPHNPEEAIPLWNRSVRGADAYKLYTASNTLTSATVNSDLTGGISIKCLSCHDGSIGLATGVANTVTGWNATAAGLQGNLDGGWFANLGTNLTNSHPIGMKYDSVDAEDKDGTDGTSQFRNSLNNKIGGILPLFDGANNVVECATCHNPHGAGAEKLLRKTNASSRLCMTCHNK